MPKKKIIYVITKSFWGGAQRYVYDLAVSLAKESFDVAVITGGNGPLVEKLRSVGIKTINLLYLERDIAIWRDIKTFFFLFKFFKREKPDIIHLNSSKIGGLGALAGKLAGVEKIIFTAHGWAFNEDRPWLVKEIIKFITWLSLLFQDKIIAVSNAVIKDASVFPFVLKKFVLIHNGIKESPMINRIGAQNFFEEKLKIKAKPETVWIGTISELTKNKGLEYAIEAMSLIRHLPFVFIIIGEGEKRENLSLLVARYGLQDKVKLFGYLDEAQKYLPAFDIFTLTSITEAFPYALLEAGQAGLATLASDVGGIRDIIENGNSGILVKPKKEKQLAENLTKMISDKNLREKLGGNLKETILSKFSFEKMLEETLLEYLP